jgi:hypothetical protein
VINQIIMKYMTIFLFFIIIRRMIKCNSKDQQQPLKYGGSIMECKLNPMDYSHRLQIVVATDFFHFCLTTCLIQKLNGRWGAIFINFENMTNFCNFLVYTSNIFDKKSTYLYQFKNDRAPERKQKVQKRYPTNKVLLEMSLWLCDLYSVESDPYRCNVLHLERPRGPRVQRSSKPPCLLGS